MSLISIIIPIYNSEKYLEECLESVLQQTYKEIEVILVDDGSVDGSGEICDRYAERDKRVVVIHQENKGVSCARNVGISVANGEFIGFADADDIIHKDFFEILYKNLVEYDADISICDCCSIVEANGNIAESNIKKINKNDMMKEIFLYDRIKGYLYNKLYKREICLRAKMLENINICEDLYYLCEIIYEDTALVYDARKMYYVRETQGSLTRTLENLFDEQDRLKYIEVLEKIIEDFYNENLEIKNAIKIQEGRLIIGVLQQIYDLNIENTSRKRYLRNEFKKTKNIIVFCKEIGLISKFSMLMTYYFPSFKKILKKLN